MRNIVFGFTFIFSIIMLMSVTSASIPSKIMMPDPAYSECTKSVYLLNISNSTVLFEKIMSCFNIFRYRNDSCDSFQEDLPNREELVVKCYGFRDSIGWEPCENITNPDIRDKCYSSNLKCDKIVNEDINKACVDKVNDNRIKSITRSIKEIIVLILFILSPIVMLFIIIKTIVDIVKKNKIKWWLRITIFIISLFTVAIIVHWFLIQYYVAQ